jgi:hypothetical protein
MVQQFLTKGNTQMKKKQKHQTQASPPMFMISQDEWAKLIARLIELEITVQLRDALDRELKADNAS